jgi:2-amino-4-hydroxy-6-hydroxymethyldihydropteridine diphosphokinase
MNEKCSRSFHGFTSAIALGSNLGSNLGDSLQIVNASLDCLNSMPEIEVIGRSPWYRTKAVISPHTQAQPDYINGCALLNTTLEPQALLEVLLNIEIQFGRVRREPWDARTLDLDLLLYENRIINTPELIIPHPRMGDRAFVLIPLAHIAPDWIHPILGKAIAELALNPADLSLSKPESIQ